MRWNDCKFAQINDLLRNRLLHLKKFCFIFLLLALLTAEGCSDSGQRRGESNAVYYWRKTFELSETERNFLKENGIEAMYVKFFDVITEKHQLRPDATIVFKDSLPVGINIIPTVFIAPTAFAEADVPEVFASMIISRVDTMMAKNHLGKAEEIQIDFDWTERNREEYFEILRQMADTLHLQGRKLSTTIRLHQLRQPTPPADYGVLMMYNTGAINSPTEPNSILSMANIEPYLKYLKGYELPLATALPIYSWDLLFRNDEFIVIARGLNHNDTTMFGHIKDNRYVARKYAPVPSSSSGAGPGVRLMPGDMLRHEAMSAALLDSVVRAVKRQRPDATERIILYHLDENTLNNYTTDEIKQIYGSH